MLRPLLALLLTFLPAVLTAGGLEMIVVGEQTLEGVLVTYEKRYQLLTHAGTTDQKVTVATIAPGKSELGALLADLAVERRGNLTRHKTEIVKKGALWVPQKTPMGNPYEPELFRKFHGRVNTHGEFVIEKLLPKKDTPSLDKFLPAALAEARAAVQEKDQAQLNMAFTVLERTGVMEEILRRVAPLLAEGH